MAQRKEKLWGNKMLEGNILREMLSVTTSLPEKKKKKAKFTKIHKMLHVSEFSSFTDSLGYK